MSSRADSTAGSEPRSARLWSASVEPASADEFQRSLAYHFEKTARRFADRIAVRFPGATLTYRELDAMADRIAAAILSSGTDSANPVTFLLPETPAFVAAAFGAMKAGRIYVPIDCANPLPWISQIIDDCQSDLILADAATIDLAANFRDRGLTILDIGAVGHETPNEKPGLALTADAPQQIVY
ncbi:MAG: AMP-binding protein, partial [Candidatus Binataceae bacterium]